MKKLFVSLTIYPNFLCLSLSLYLEKKKVIFLSSGVTTAAVHTVMWHSVYPSYLE